MPSFTNSLNHIGKLFAVIIQKHHIMDNIPIVDLSQFTEGNAQERADFIQRLGHAFEQIGFVAVKNHGIAEDLIQKLYEITKAFFALPLDKKRTYEIPELAGQRGYTSFGKEHAKGSDAADLKEFFQFGQITAPDSPLKKEYPDNVQVKEIPDFNPTLEKAYRAFEKSGLSLLQAIADYLHIGEHYFDEFVKDGNSILRSIYYPPITSEPKSAIRAEQHEDINLITLLVGASADGLQVLPKEGDWLAIKSAPNQIVVNVGDMLQRLTNNRLKSTTHRVVNPPREKWGMPRYSIPFFLHPKSSMSLAALSGCVNADHPKHYPDVTAGAYLDERLREIGLKK